MRPMLNYYGGKWSQAEWIIEHFPDHEMYVEAFGGAASVLLRKPRSTMEVVNDIDDEVFNVYRAVRDHGTKLRRLLSMTPYSRTEYELSREPAISDIERARRTIVRTYLGIGDSLNQRNGFRMSKLSNVTPEKTWQTYVQALDETIERFRGVLIERLDYRKLIEKYDTPGTLWYLDPPYVKSERSNRHGYRHDFNDEDHAELMKHAFALKGMVIVSGYDSALYDQYDWRKVTRKVNTNSGLATETLWLCPKVSASEKQASLF